MSEFTKEELRVLKAIAGAVLGEATSAPALEEAEEEEAEEKTITQEEILAMDQDELLALAKEAGIEGAKKMSLKELRKAVLAAGGAEEEAEDEDAGEAEEAEDGEAEEAEDEDAGEEEEEEKPLAKKPTAYKPLPVGTVVKAKWYQDGGFYKAKVLSDKVIEGKVKLKFVDDGFVQMTKTADFGPLK